MTVLSFTKSLSKSILPEWAGQITASTLRADIFAGFTGATVVLPQAVAFASTAGLPAQYGFYTAIVIPIVAALFGSSRIMVSGPTLVISALVFSTLNGRAMPESSQFIEMAIVLALLVGVFQLAFGLLRLGNFVSFVSHSVMIGFTAAAALLIMVSQLKDALGVSITRGKTIFETVVNLSNAAPETNSLALTIAAVTLVTIIGFRVFAPKLPGFIIALFVGSALGALLDAGDHGVRMIGTLPSLVPSLSPPGVSLGLIRELSEGAIALALLGLLEAISIGRAFAIKTGDRFDANREIVAQGVSNITGSFFQCYAGSGSFTRSGVNYETGARTPISAIASSAFLVAILLVVAPLFARIPVPTIAAVIIYVAFRLIDLSTMRHIVTTSKTETAILVATILAGLFISLEFAVYAGVIISLSMFLTKTARPALVVAAPDPNLPRRPFRNIELNELQECPQAVFVRLDGTLYFGSVDYLVRELDQIALEKPSHKYLVLILRGVGLIDLPGAELIIQEVKRRRSLGGDLFLVARYPPLAEQLRRFHVFDALGEGNIVDSKADAIERLVSRLDPDICRTCRARIFLECASRPGGD